MPMTGSGVLQRWGEPRYVDIRRNTRNRRVKTLFKKADERRTMCAGGVFVRFVILQDKIRYYMINIYCLQEFRLLFTAVYIIIFGSVRYNDINSKYKQNITQKTT